MTTIIKRKADGKVERVEKNIETTNVKRPELHNLYIERMEAYKRVSSGKVTTGKLNRGKEALTVNSYDLQDNLQNAIIKALGIKETIEKPEHLLNKCLKQAKIDSYRKGKNADENGKVSAIVEFSTESVNLEIEKGINSDYYNELNFMIEHIESIIMSNNKKKSTDEKRNEFKLFKLYFVEGETVESLARRFGTNKMDISRKLKRIKNKMLKANLRELFDSRFASPDYAESCPSYPVFKPEKPGEVEHINIEHINIEDYEAQKTVYHMPLSECIPTEYLDRIDSHAVCPTKEKNLFDDYVYIVDNNHDNKTMEYKRIGRKLNYQGDLNNPQGSMSAWFKVNKKYK